MITPNASDSLLPSFRFFSRSKRQPKICHVLMEFIFISPYTPSSKEGIQSRIASSQYLTDKNNKKNNIFISQYNGCLLISKAISTFTLIFYTPLIFIFFASFRKHIKGDRKEGAMFEERKKSFANKKRYIPCYFHLICMLCCQATQKCKSYNETI